ncbi:MAG: hypothetical protein L7V86_15680 [Verrucomicrobiales bacterium]|nr:hypothetical protein [Verrucomicrobiales bacterium]
MTKPILLRLILGVLAIFLAGLVAGAFLGARFQLETQTKRAEIGNLSENVMSMLDKRLALSPEQSESIRPHVNEASDELRAVYEKSSAEVSSIMGEYYKRMLSDLTEEQAAILKEMEAELREKARRLDGDSG